MLFHRKSTENPFVSSTGASPEPDRSSSTTSSLSVNLRTTPSALHVAPPDWSFPPAGYAAWRSRSASPTTSLAISSSAGNEKYASRLLFNPTSHRTLRPSLLCDSFCARSWSASIFSSGPKTFWYW